MTFAEYNTDENFDRKESSLDELVKIGIGEGKTSDEIRNSLSPKWQKSKKIGEFDNYVKQYSTAPKEEAPKTEEKPVEEVIEQTSPKTEENKAPKKNTTTSKISDKDKSFLESESGISENAEDEENKRQKELEQQRWNATNDRMKKSGEAFGNIDDKLVAQLPTFMFKRYHNGEFGDPKSSDAKLRLAHFMINGVGTALQNASAAIKGGAMQESDIQKYNRTNLEQGLENRWNKYKQETQTAIDLAKEQGANEQDLQSSIARISSNNRLQTAFNMMNENEKVYTLRVLSKIGNEIGSMNNKDFVNTLIGYATSGDNLSWQEAAELLIARFGKDAMGAIKAANEDGVTEDGKDVGAGIGGIGNNLKGYETIDGETVDFEMIADKDKKAQLRALMDDLSNRFYNEQIDEATFRKYYEPLYGESKKHIGTGSKSADALLAENKKRKQSDLNNVLNDLQTQAKAGTISPGDYTDKFDKIKADLKKWGLDEKDLARVEKSRISRETILKSVEKANKKKK